MYNNPTSSKHKCKVAVVSNLGLFSNVGGSLFWVFPKIGVPQTGWFIRETPIKMDDLGGPPLFLETPFWNYTI